MNYFIFAIALVLILFTLYLFYLDKTYDRKVVIPLFEKIYKVVRGKRAGSAMGGSGNTWDLCISDIRVPKKIYKKKSYKIEVNLLLEMKDDKDRIKYQGLESNKFPSVRFEGEGYEYKISLETDGVKRWGVVSSVPYDYYLEVDIKSPPIELEEITPSRLKFEINKSAYNYSWVGHFSESGEYLIIILIKVIEAGNKIKFSKSLEYGIKVVTLDGLTSIQLRYIKYTVAVLSFLITIFSFLNYNF